MALLYILGTVVAVLSAYLWHVNRAMSTTPEEARKLASKRWTKEELREAYEKEKNNPKDIREYLPKKQGRRYIVTGGSGLVGGWVVQHLILRGEDPAAIRILDISKPTRPEIQNNNIRWIPTDISDAKSVLAGFNEAWPSHVQNLPLTVFHIVAFIGFAERVRDFLDKYLKINTAGTKHVLGAAKYAGCSAFVATSSGSVGLVAPKFWLYPWQKSPKDWFQLCRNFEPVKKDADFGDLPMNYVVSKLRAERLVLEADDKVGGFRTGALRPGHAIYGHGVENRSSCTWTYLTMGGGPTWIPHVITPFVHAQNVSIAHLQYEARLTNPGDDDIGGRAYACSDAGPPISFGDLYLGLSSLVHPSTPCKFTPVSPALMLCLAYAVEAYVIFRHRYASGILPELKGDIATMQPSMFNVSTLHIGLDDSKARVELGYEGALTTLEGVAMQMVEWNKTAERKMKEGKQDQLPGETTAVPQVPTGVAK